MIQAQLTGWKYYNHALVPTCAPHDEPRIEILHTVDNVWQNRGGVIFLIRYTTDFDCEEQTGFWYVIKDTFGGMEELTSNTRRKVRKALKSYDIHIITPEEFRRIALKIYNGALSNYKVKASTVTQEHIDAMSFAPQQEYWGVYVKGTDEAVAVARNVVTDECCDYGTLKCLPEALHNATYPYYGLIHEMNRYYLQEKGLRYVCDGARSITEHSNVQPFLIDTFHFRKAYCRLHIVYRRWMKPIINILYPFRKHLPLNVRSLLNMEAMKRGEM